MVRRSSRAVLSWHQRWLQAGSGWFDSRTVAAATVGSAAAWVAVAPSSGRAVVPISCRGSLPGPDRACVGWFGSPCVGSVQLVGFRIPIPWWCRVLFGCCMLLWSAMQCDRGWWGAVPGPLCFVFFLRCAPHRRELVSGCTPQERARIWLQEPRSVEVSLVSFLLGLPSTV